MTNEFKREARYVVLKSADVMKCLTVSELIELRRIQAKVEEHRAEIGKPPLDCVVVESDWPEYEPTWKAIEARVPGAQNALEESAVQTAARIMNVDLIRQRDAAELMSLALRAKIAEMEKQEPFGWLLDGDFYEVRQKSLYSGDGPIPGQKALYALPGAQPAPSAPSEEAAAEMGANGGHVVEAERLAFEAWMRGHCWKLGAKWTGTEYRSAFEKGGMVDMHAMRTRELWAAWRDRAALAAAPEAKP